MADNLSEKLAEVAIVAETRLDDPIYQNIEIRDPVEDDDDDVTPTNSVPYQNCHINFLKCQLLPYLLVIIFLNHSISEDFSDQRHQRDFTVSLVSVLWTIKIKKIWLLIRLIPFFHFLLGFRFTLSL
ncbi:hypothetical protein L3Y34_014078 [Caenorhabditis briggsae]|uniref:Uncharacterized protein n=1 Tax=Caenorhabditis briggsae TaxID=6238 RepID=A0AAE9IXP0_CAEBR|nr:hypothetical protein L3Y34_014078 [Caenorhabditis briggsae]